MTFDVLMIYCTVPDLATGERIARTVVDERLAACVNILPSVRSIYRWNGVVEAADECQLLMKTAASRFEALRDRLTALHPYELPEIVAVKIELGTAAYLDWVLRESSGA